ncbi:hypothetical protein CAI21_15055 [Alkalilimnicola ehrlichii]|uniref:Lipoprotein n=1 Tax=Alkalilimnicola ehrlichii TaxID=351052 RepID=A0A3E0WT64_9GAMM|nr:hypothetical protein [Alkalilimnicola ehrlichii]RFA27167.1 hypothetical protein CAI21_15055 [Alkalilimnicola ehrlichii]RFA35341.1 hypothetical protein CAL65_12715 [Alkalilimnicola ehrlichii]
MRRFLAVILFACAPSLGALEFLPLEEFYVEQYVQPIDDMPFEQAKRALLDQRERYTYPYVKAAIRHENDVFMVYFNGGVRGEERSELSRKNLQRRQDGLPQIRTPEPFGALAWVKDGEVRYLRQAFGTHEVGSERTFWVEYHPYERYGCLYQSPLRLTEHFGSDYPLLVFIGGRGERGPPVLYQSVADYIQVSFFSGNEFQHEVRTMLMALNYGDARRPSIDEHGPSWRDTAFDFPAAHFAVGIDPHSERWERFFPVQSEAGEGRRVFGKLFVLERDDAAPALFVWRKAYVSSLKEESFSGFTFESEAYEMFELTATADDYRLAPQALSPSEGQALIERHELRWREGWPSKSECHDSEGEEIEFWREGITIPG